MKKIISTNPAQNYEKIGEVVASTAVEIHASVDAANQGKESWGMLPVSERVKALTKAYEIFKSRHAEIVNIISQEIGTPLSEVDGEVSWDWDYFQWFIDNVESALSPHTSHESASSLHQIYYEPLGSVAVITPWNLPFDLFIWGVIPNLLVGNTVVYKASEECVLSGKLFGEIMESVGLPKGVFNIIHGDGEEGKILTESNIDAIWFTGSSEVGQKLYELAGKKFIRSILEMGGSNPAIVCEDADLDLATTKIVSKRFMFSGQTCDADKRVIVHENIKKQFIEKLVGKVKSLPTTPLVSQKQLDHLIEQVNDARSKGATILVGGSSPTDLHGAYYLPTVVDDVTSDMKVWHEEVFGPVLPIVSYKSDSEAVALANDTEYGLGSQVFTKDQDKANYFALRIKAGNVDINGVGHFIPQNPFGGYKHSGIGREHGMDGFRELCQVKTVSRPK
jgi:succinate-semialdehyde dehydrogenase/glutarate-semialdehyde dehydrogenase